MASILIIDDDPDAADLVARAMRRGGHHAETAPNGREAITRLGGALPDLVVLDMRMPEMDGVRFLEVLRSYLRWQHVPVVLLTAYPEGPDIEQAAELGASDVFRKGDLDLEELLAAVGEKLRARAAPPAHSALPPSAHA
jgi:CheY-like chemotaxis protein